MSVFLLPLSVDARSWAWVCGHSLVGVAASNPTGNMDVCLLCCVLSGRGFALGRSLVQRSPTECGVSECDREASIMKRPWPTRAVEPQRKSVLIFETVWWLYLRQSPMFGFDVNEMQALKFVKMYQRRHSARPS